MPGFYRSVAVLLPYAKGEKRWHLMSQTVSPDPARFSSSKQIRIAAHGERSDKLSWRTALLVMFVYCVVAWAGIGLLVGKLID